MIQMRTEVNVDELSGQKVIDFMLNCTDEAYQRWWEGTHLAFHTVKRYPNNLGNIVYFDEYIGKRRLCFTGVVTEIIPGKKLVWQMKKIVRLPGWLELNFEDREGGVNIIHTLAVGYRGIGKILDPILRLFLSQDFESELEKHAQIEFHKLAEILM